MILLLCLSILINSGQTENSTQESPNGNDQGSDNECFADQGSIQCGFSIANTTAKNEKESIKSEQHAWPWLVSIQKKNEGKHLCQGSIIDRNWVLTAAHCLFDDPAPEAYKLLVGTNDIGSSGVKREGGKYHETKQIKFYPDYESLGSAPDLALMQVDPPFCFDDFVRPVCLTGNEMAEDTGCFLAGWALLEEFDDKLHEIEVPIISYETCSSGEFYGKMVKPFEICAGYSPDGRGSCQGDNGGPLNCMVNGAFVIQGVVSRGEGCTLEQKPGIFTDVTSKQVIRWIERKTGHSFPLKVEAEMLPNGLIQGSRSAEITESSASALLSHSWNLLILLFIILSCILNNY